MLQKLAPLFILMLFILGTMFVIWGLERASEMTQPKKIEQKEK